MQVLRAIKTTGYRDRERLCAREVRGNIVGKGLGRLAERLLVYSFSKKHAEVLRKEGKREGKRHRVQKAGLWRTADDMDTVPPPAAYATAVWLCALSTPSAASSEPCRPTRRYRCPKAAMCRVPERPNHRLPSRTEGG
jgi:hypothetical protein